MQKIFADSDKHVLKVPTLRILEDKQFLCGALIIIEMAINLQLRVRPHRLAGVTVHASLAVTRDGPAVPGHRHLTMYTGNKHGFIARTVL